MASFKLLDLTGLTYFYNKCKDVFASADDVDAFKVETETYVTEVDYTPVSFDTKQSYTEFIDL